MQRTHTCGELTIKDVGKEVRLLGWVHRRRDHGSLIFIDLRDRSGLSQIVFLKKSKEDSGEVYKKACELKPEFVISIQGQVNKRPRGSENKKIPTGEVEINVSSLEILNPSETPPFEIEDNIELSEDTRLTYRYLDLRRPASQAMLTLRHKTYKRIRDFLDAQGFIEVETPLLTKSTPEGARDYLVPSRLNPGKFYALPQSPQLFKQILMASGVEKYFQIARCFRDEDLRSDRQPEFTQLDMEMSFIDETDIRSVSEELIKLIFKETINVKLKTPFKRLTYKQAMEEFGTDKPDLRSRKKDEFAFVWIDEFPLFKYNADLKRWEMEHHPFTAPQEDDLANFEKDPASIISRAYDLVVNGVEIGSGSIRIHKRGLQEKIFKIINLPPDEVKKRFGFLLEAFNYGCPPHGGIAFGLDRMIALLSGKETIRDVIAFPKTQKAICPLTGAPSEVSDAQLKELNLPRQKRD